MTVLDGPDRAGVERAYVGPGLELSPALYIALYWIIETHGEKPINRTTLFYPQSEDYKKEVRQLARRLPGLTLLEVGSRDPKNVRATEGIMVLWDVWNGDMLRAESGDTLPEAIIAISRSSEAIQSWTDAYNPAHIAGDKISLIPPEESNPPLWRAMWDITERVYGGRTINDSRDSSWAKSGLMGLRNLGVDFTQNQVMACALKLKWKGRHVEDLLDLVTSINKGTRKRLVPGFAFQQYQVQSWIR